MGWPDLVIRSISGSGGEACTMSGIQITIALDDAELEAKLDRAIEGGDDLRQPMAEIAEEWLTHVQSRFAEERDPLGVPWQKRRVEPGQQDAPRNILHLSGDLERQVRPDTGSDYAQIGVERSAGPGKYARIHNEGGEIVPKNKKALSFGGRLVSRVVMPKRQFLGFGPAEQKTVEDVMGDWLRLLFGAAA